MRCLSHPALVALGPISYATYCVQGPLVDFMNGMYVDMTRYYVVLTYFSLAFTIGGFITYYIDDPLRRLLMNCCLRQ